MTLAQDEMQNFIDSALALVLRRSPSGALTFTKEELKFTGAIHIQSADDANVTFTVVDRSIRQ